MIVSLKAQTRNRAGKGGARAVRRNSMAPAVMYGAKKTPIMLQLDPRDIVRELETGVFFNTLYNVGLEGKTYKVLPRDVQFHVVKDTVEHIDFLLVDDSDVIKVFVPIKYRGLEDNPAVRMGGNLQIVRREVELNAVISKIPKCLYVDVSRVKFGGIVRMSDVELEEGLSSVISDRDFVLASMKSPRGENTEEESVTEESSES